MFPSFQGSLIDSSFNEKQYVGATKLNSIADAYKRHQFNQIASDKLSSRRNVPDTRNGR